MIRYSKRSFAISLKYVAVCEWTIKSCAWQKGAIGTRWEKLLSSLSSPLLSSPLFPCHPPFPYSLCFPRFCAATSNFKSGLSNLLSFIRLVLFVAWAPLVAVGTPASLPTSAEPGSHCAILVYRNLRLFQKVI